MRDRKMVETRPAEGVDGLRRRPAVCRTPEGRGASGCGSDASPDRGREEGGQSCRIIRRCELSTAERLARTFEAKYPGIAVRVERSGAERIFQRIAQEQGSGIRAVDVANSTDPAHYLEWKKSDWLAPYVPEDVAKHFPADQIDPDGMHATSCAWMEVIGYNTNLVKRDALNKLRRFLLDPKWHGKMVKGHPGYSGAVLTATFVLARDLGWPYLEKLAQQKVMQVQSAADPPKKILLVSAPSWPMATTTIWC